MTHEWYVVTTAGERGPYTSQALAELARYGGLAPSTLVRRSDADQAKPARQVRGLFERDPAVAPAERGAVEMPSTPTGARPQARVTPRVRPSGPARARPFAAPAAADAGPDARPPFRAVKELGVLLTSLFGAVVVLSLVDVVLKSQIPQPELRLVRGTYVRATEVTGIEAAAAAAGLLRTLGLFATVVVFLVWFRACHRNVAALGAPCRWSHGWAIGAWFVPLGHLVLPYLVARDIQRSTGQPHGALLLGWWLAWAVASVVDGFMARAALGRSMRTGDVPAVLPTPGEEFLTHLFTAVAAVLAAAVVWTVSRAQEEKAAALAG